MQSAILFVVAWSMGVTVGWQPMPDGSPRYEYVVQLDRELLATMKRGQSIPISSEVPDDVRPIARIRIVVGEEELPRQKLVTQFKPWPAGSSETAVVETQYVEPAVTSSSGPRYQNQPILPADGPSRQILPSDSRPSSDAKSFGQALQRSAEQARSASSGNQILPPQNRILPSKSGQRSTEPIRTANQLNGRSRRNQGSSSQTDIQQLFGTAQGGNQGGLRPVDERSIVAGNRDNVAPRTRGSNALDSQQILPPPSGAMVDRSSANTVEIRNSNDSAAGGPRYQPRDQRIAAEVPARQNQVLPSRAPVRSQPGVFNAPWPPPERFEDAPLAQEWNSQQTTNPRLVSRPSDNTAMPEWPKTEEKVNSFDIAAPQDKDRIQDPGGTLVLNGSSNSQRLQNPAATPEIRREMLSQPADAELQTASGESVRQASGSFSPLPPPGSFAAGQSTVVSGPPPAGAEATAARPPVFPLILAWVLLSGSGAGNAYLLWNYLGIRYKYQGLVRTAGRKAGRLSNHDEYDDYNH